MIEDVRRGVADLFHRPPHAARRFVNALFTSSIGRLADARHKRKWAVKDTNNLADGDVGRLAPQGIAPASSLLALQQAVTLQVEENGFEKLLRNPLLFCQIRDQYRPACNLLCLVECGLAAVFRLLGEPCRQSSGLLDYAASAVRRSSSASAPGARCLRRSRSTFRRRRSAATR